MKLNCLQLCKLRVKLYMKVVIAACHLVNQADHHVLCFAVFI